MKVRDDIGWFGMGKVSLCAAGTGKNSVAVAEEPDGHPLEPQTPVVADGTSHVGTPVSESSPAPWTLLGPGTIPSALPPLALRGKN